ncbi:MAG: DEAD/DEAH box helicase [Candidatus Moranbacteria bacterium]|nr:DEAD/DEAH box helicase [Candidatus Moranbacteria bacterium]
MFSRNSRSASHGRGGSPRGNTRSGGHSSGGNRGGSRFGGGRSGGGSGRGKSQYIDPALFVKKAIQVTETTVFQPEHLFADFEIHAKLKENVAKRKYVHPTPIQDGAIPHILKGRDVIGIANTGTGKTAAFLLPLINKMFTDKKSRALILVPTRELALQIDEEFLDFSNGSGLLSALCIGGSHLQKQVMTLRRHPEFVIGTPGRIKDLIERGALDLSNFNNIVLDEVDRMMDMGFLPDMKYLLGLMKKERQSLFFSATLEKGARELAEKFLNNPVTVAIKSRPTSENVDQDVVHVGSATEKIEVLHELLLQYDFKKVIAFVRTKRNADKLAQVLTAKGFKAGAIHGDLSQGQRQRALQAFKDNRMQILIATDVAARGLDIDDVTHVINYDVPATFEDYVHRIGRTGRGNKTGIALTFIEN